MNTGEMQEAVYEFVILLFALSLLHGAAEIRPNRAPAPPEEHRHCSQ